MFIAVDLKVIEGTASATARAAGVHEDRILAGLTRLWHRCWSQTTDHVTLAQLAGVMGGERIAEVAAALVEHGFLETSEGAFRVRGAARYLRLKESRRAGAEKTNSARSKSARERRSRATLSDAQATLPDALSPITEHRSPKSKDSAPAARPRDSDALCQDFEAVTGTRYAWNGAKDGAAFAWLLKQGTLEQVRERWRAGLRAEGWKSVRSVAQLRAKWNDLAPASSGLGTFTQNGAQDFIP